VQTGWNDDAAATQQRARDDPSFRQVYLRYFGGAS
jgi:type IV secretory pathway TrbD component